MPFPVDHLVRDCPTLRTWAFPHTLAPSLRGCGLGGPDSTLRHKAASTPQSAAFFMPWCAQFWRPRWGAERLAGFCSAGCPVRQPAWAAAFLAEGGSSSSACTQGALHG